LNSNEIVANLPGKIVTSTSFIVWEGNIPQGQTLVLDLAGDLPPISQKALQTWMQAAVLADDGNRLTQSSVTLSPFTLRNYWPFMARDGK
jgi:hypothetical protein